MHGFSLLWLLLLLLKPEDGLKKCCDKECDVARKAKTLEILPRLSEVCALPFSCPAHKGITKCTVQSYKMLPTLRCLLWIGMSPYSQALLINYLVNSVERNPPPYGLYPRPV